MLLYETLVELPSRMITMFLLWTNAHGYRPIPDETSQKLSEYIKRPPNKETAAMLPEPIFDTSFDRNITIMVDQTAFFECFVRNLNDRAVSWVRHEDVHIMAAGTYTYTSDERFIPMHPRPEEGREEWSKWVLKLRFVQKRDEGIYECQISTRPIKSIQYQLNVVTPKAKVLGPSVQYVLLGGIINITCFVYYTTEESSYFFWYLNNAVVPYDTRDEVTLKNVLGKRISHSQLVIRDVKYSDNGTYRCLPSNTNGVEVEVVVTNTTITTPEPPITEAPPEELIEQIKNNSEYERQKSGASSAGYRPQIMQIGLAGSTITLECLTVCLILIHRITM